MDIRTPGRRSWEVKHALRLGTFVSLCLLAGSLWFLWGRIRMLEEPHNPHYEPAHCFDCHDSQGSKMTAQECFECHDNLDRSLKPGAVAKREAMSKTKKCNHPVKRMNAAGLSTVTSLCLSCHKKPLGYVAMIDITKKQYVEIDMKMSHPIGLLPTESIHPKTLPLSKETGAINCITCHDQHGQDRRMRLLRYYYPGNGRPADFRPLCLDCHEDGWLPLKIKPDRMAEVVRRHD